MNTKNILIHYKFTKERFLQTLSTFVWDSCHFFSAIKVQESNLHIKHLRKFDSLKILWAQNRSFRVIYFLHKGRKFFSENKWHHVVTFRTKRIMMFCSCSVQVVLEILTRSKQQTVLPWLMLGKNKLCTDEDVNILQKSSKNPTLMNELYILITYTCFIFYGLGGLFIAPGLGFQWCFLYSVMFFILTLKLFVLS